MKEAEFIPITSTEHHLQYNLDLFGRIASDHLLLRTDYVAMHLLDAIRDWFKKEKQLDLKARCLRKCLVPNKLSFWSNVHLCYVAKCLVLGTRPDQEFQLLEKYFAEYVLRELLGQTQWPVPNNKKITFSFDETKLIDGQDMDIGEDECWKIQDFGHL